MKKIHLISILMIAGAILLLTTAAEDMGSYSTFTEAIHTGQKVKIVGQLAKDKQMYYNPEEDPNYFSFFLKDQEGAEREVVLLREKPRDFEQSEQLVLTGRMNGDQFIATDVLMKCPSKYKDEEVYLREKS